MLGWKCLCSLARKQSRILLFLAYVIVCQHSHTRLRVWRLIIPHISNETLANPLLHFSCVIRGTEFSTAPHPCGSRHSEVCLQKAQELFQVDQLTQGLYVRFLHQTAYLFPTFFLPCYSSTPCSSPWCSSGVLPTWAFAIPPSVHQYQPGEPIPAVFNVLWWSFCLVPSQLILFPEPWSTSCINRTVFKQRKELLEPKEGVY